jgi:uncharacterized phage protein (TIGR01671 family)
MREIKFRAWDKTKKMFLPLDAFAAYTALPNCLITMVEDWENYRAGEFGYTDYFELMQFTGLKDKNGKEIYEGDVLRYVSKNPFSLGEARKVRVYYIDARFWCNGSGIGIYLGELLVEERCEVIGNIHENPELLNQI